MAKTKQEKTISLLHDYQATFTSVEGKRVLQDLMSKSGFLKNNYVAGDPHGTSFNEGATSIVRYILQTLKCDVNKLKAYLEEETEDEY